jgi:hypothetical protein
MLLLKRILKDTLQRDGKWSSTLLTMFVFSVSLFLYGWVDFFLHGFNSEVFFAFVGLASGIKVTDSISKKIKQ